MINSQWMFKLPIHQWIASINLNYWLIFSKTRRNHLKRSHFLIAKHSRRPPFWRTTRICYVRQPLTDLTHVAFTFYISFYCFTAFISIQKRCSFLPFRNKRMRERDREKHRHRSRSRSRSPSRKRRSRSRSRSPRRKHDRPSSPVASKSKSSKEKKSIPDNNDKELKR